jgi:hypothetical protein
MEQSLTFYYFFLLNFIFKRTIIIWARIFTGGADGHVRANGNAGAYLREWNAQEGEPTKFEILAF